MELMLNNIFLYTNANIFSLYLKREEFTFDTACFTGMAARQLAQS